MRQPALFILLVICQIGLAQIDDFSNTDFSKADSIALVFSGHSLLNLYKLTDSLTSDLDTDVEKFRAIYKWVCANIENDYYLFSKNKIKREKSKNRDRDSAWNKAFNKVVFKTLIENRSTVCTGYAYLIKEMSANIGIRSIMIDGYGRTAQSNLNSSSAPNHTWNAVLLNGKWYLCDATWAAGAIDVENKRFIRSYNNGYFLTDPALFVKNHYPLDTTWILLRDKPTFNEFLNGPLVYKDLFSTNIQPLTPHTFEVVTKRNHPISFTFQSRDSNNRIGVAIGSGGQEYFPKVHQNEPGSYFFEHKFTRTGIYAVHIMANGVAIYSYRVKVRQDKE